MLFIILILCCVSVLPAQTVSSSTKNTQDSEYIPMLVAGNQWNELYFPTLPPDQYYENTYISKLGRDTIIDDVTYFKFLTAKDEHSSVWETVGFIREDVENRKVYLKPLDKPELLLYNFDVNIGDTISTHDTRTYKEVFIIIREMEFVSIGEKLRKKMTVQSMGVDSVNRSSHEHIWIEGIGCLEGGLIMSTTATTLYGAGLYLLCFLREEALIYKQMGLFENKDCFTWSYPINIKEITSSNSTYYKIWQANSKLYINSEKQISCTIELFDLSGRILQHRKTDDGNLILDVNDYAAGVHILRITSNNSVSNHKILITK